MKIVNFEEMKIILLCLLLSFISCNNESNISVLEPLDSKAALETKDSFVADFQCVAKVKGMVCKMGCGASIRKGLTELDGVTLVEIDFDEALDEQIVKISYNSDQQSSANIFSKLESLNKGQFSIGDSKSGQIKNSSQI